MAERAFLRSKQSRFRVRQPPQKAAELFVSSYVLY